MIEPADAEADRVVAYLTARSGQRAGNLRTDVQRAVIDDNIARLAACIDGFARPEIAGLTLDDAWTLLNTAWGSEGVRTARCVVDIDQFRALDDRMATDVVGAIGHWAARIPSHVRGVLMLSSEQDLALARDINQLSLAFRAQEAGWQVLTETIPTSGHLFLLELCTPDETMHLIVSRDAVSLEGISCQVLWNAAPILVTEEGGGHHVLFPSSAPAAMPDGQATHEAGDLVERLSVRDLFGDHIMLRDLEPRAATLDGLRSLRSELGWDPAFIPRKNEPEYAQALLRIIEPLFPEGPRDIIYIGDTLLNDGGALRGLQAAGTAADVWGFLCGATAAGNADDFILSDVYFGARWASLTSFFDYVRARGGAVGEGTCAFFDLDQTVYAAKRRDDRPLHLARWDAVRRYLQNLVPSYRFDEQRAEALYRDFDRDGYHPVTRDNMDYVVLLVLAVISGLAEAGEIREYATSSRPSIGALAEELRRRAAVRLSHEEIEPVLNAIKAIHYNTLAGDQT